MVQQKVAHCVCAFVQIKHKVFKMYSVTVCQWMMELDVHPVGYQTLSLHCHQPDHLNCRHLLTTRWLQQSYLGKQSVRAEGALVVEIEIVLVCCAFFRFLDVW